MGAKLERNKIVESKVAADLTPYCLRHTFATDCIRADVHIDNVRWLLGHSDIAMTANTYSHRDNDTLHRSISLVDTLDSTGAGGKPGGTQNDATHSA